MGRGMGRRDGGKVSIWKVKVDEAHWIFRGMV